jgi:FkbM family methyltransferase
MPDATALDTFHRVKKSMGISSLFRTINAINPTSHGRLFTMEFAKKVGALPKDGVYAIEDGIKMDLHMNEFIERSIYFNAFEFLCTKIILSHLSPGSNYLDIGANVGYYCLKAARRVGSTGRVLAVEPNPQTLEKLNRNISLSGVTGIEIFACALSESDGEVSIFCPTDDTHGFASMRNQGWNNFAEFKVPARRLDDVLPSDLKSIDFLKIDVEGAEKLVFAGAEATIQRYKPPILMEINEKAAQNFGYSSFDAVRMLLKYNPAYRLQFIDHHSITATTLEGMERDKITDGNVLLKSA